MCASRFNCRFAYGLTIIQLVLNYDEEWITLCIHSLLFIITSKNKPIFIPKISMEVFFIRKNELPTNNEIRDREVRLIDTDGTMLGVMSSMDAQKLAIAKNLDLVKIVPNAAPPVCKIMDYGKSIFEQAKKEKEARKSQKVVLIKEVRLSATIEEHDFDFKVKNAYRFLKEGDKVKVSIRFRGREMKYTVTGKEVLAKFADAVNDVGMVEKQPKLEGKNMMMILNPKKQ